MTSRSTSKKTSRTETTLPLIPSYEKIDALELSAIREEGGALGMMQIDAEHAIAFYVEMYLNATLYINVSGNA